MEALINMDFKGLNQLIIDIAEKYFQARQDRAHQNDKKQKENSLEFDEYLSKVQIAFNSLSESEKNLINNEFFYQNYTWWWKTLYSKATFYRYKKEAMMKFLEAFYNE